MLQFAMEQRRLRKAQGVTGRRAGGLRCAYAEDKRLLRKLMAGRISRRRFLAQSAGAGALLAALPATAGAAVSWSRTLFFNFSHLPSDRGLMLVVAGRSYPLTRTVDNPSVLSRAKGTNRFLAGIADSSLTHHLQGVALAADICTLAYAYQMIDSVAGTWQMTGLVQMIPDSAHVAAYGRMRAITPDGSLPLSVKRQKYGLPPAILLQDVLDEQVLIDSTDHARTLIALHPDLLSAEPVSAAYVKNHYVENDIGTTILAQQIDTLGPAQPESVSTGGWATLRPLTDDNGQPFKMPGDGRNQYFPDFNSSVDPLVANSVATLHPAVKNDPNLGTDVTGLAPADDNPSNSFSGTLWFRHDGVAGVSRSFDAALDDTPTGPQLKQVNGQMGLVVSQPGVMNHSDGSNTLTLNNFSNWFLRFLGMYIQYIGPDQQPIPLSKLNRSEIFPGNAPLSSLDLTGSTADNQAFFGGILPPAFAVAGIPVAPGNYSIAVQFPTAASTIKVFFGGIGGNGSRLGPAQAENLGIALTAAINYGLVAFFMAIGTSGIDAAVKLLINVAGQALAQEILTGLQTSLDGAQTDYAKTGLAFLKALLNGFAGKGLTELIALIVGYVTAATAEAMVPVVGTIARVVAAVIGAVQLVETSIEVGISPPVYEFDIVRSHDVTVTILPDPQNGVFPQLPNGYTLYYKVNYLFDDASPHYLDAVPLSEPYPKSLIVPLPNLPQGGQINVSVGFYAQVNGQAVSPNDWCAAKGTTGLQDNVLNNAFTITIEQIKIPITQDTVYTHKAVTILDSAGNHQWLITSQAPAYLPPSGGQQPGSLGALRSITVRQSTSKQAGYVGYSWQGYSSGLLDCTAGARGQLDQAANLNTDPVQAQSGYANTPCGQQGGATAGMKLCYNLLNADGMNFFLDTKDLYIRQVNLSNPPSFSNPTVGTAFGKLNLASTALLLHPAGHAVSINNSNHKLEVLKLPATAQNDSDAQTNYLARAVSGQGSRPGLMTSPAAVAVSPEGVILVLEGSQGNNRLQAFDLGGNPIPYFPKQATPYFLPLSATQQATYLDLAVEFSGFIYVLAQGADGVFRLDLYHPGQSDTQPISTTRNVNGAKLCVDFWRTVYTLNYQVLQLPNGQYPGLTEPSVSSWLPSLPSA